jgi:c-di-GMP-binding flagellar brake protein YcgR
VDATLHSSFRPLQPDESDEFLVEGTMAVRSLVRELLGSRSLVVIYAADDLDVFLVTRIVALEADSVEFDFTGGSEHRDALLAAPFLTVVGTPGPVKIQFRITGAESIPALPSAGPDAGARLSAPLPARGWRVQRRNAFRVRPRPEDGARVVVRAADGGELTGRLTDLSAGGLAFEWPPEQAVPELGATLRHCRMEADGHAPIPCELHVVRVDRGEEDPAARISAEFHAMPHEVSRLVQLYVMELEKRARRDSARRAG